MPWTYPHSGVLMRLLYGSDLGMLRRAVHGCAQRIEAEHESREVSDVVVDFLPREMDSEGMLRAKLLVLLDQALLCDFLFRVSVF